MQKILPKTGQNASHIDKDFRLINWLPTSKRVDQCINIITFKFVNSTCPYYLKEIFEFAPHCRVDTRNKFAKLKIPFTRQTWGRKLFHLFVLLYGTVYLNQLKKQII